MRKLLLASATLLAATSPTFAASTTIDVNASQPAVCEIVANSGSIPLAGYNVAVSGNFQYKCNFIGDPTFNFKSAYGGVKTTENGGATATYGIFLNDDTPAVAGYPAPINWLQSSGATGPGVTYFGGALNSGISSSTTPNSVVTPVFELGLTGPLTVAGYYSDTLTITITP